MSGARASEAEAAAVPDEHFIIGALLKDPLYALSVCDKHGLSRASFMDVKTRDAFSKISEIISDGSAVDTVAIATEMGGDDIVNLEFLARCQELCVSPMLAPHHAKAVQAAEQIRTIARAARATLEAIARGDPVGDICETLRSAGEAVESSRIGGPLVYTFPPMRFSYLSNLEVKPEENHIVGKGWLRRGAWSLFTGSTGIGKSVLAEQLSACVACGKSVFGLSVSRPFKVLLLTAENDEETLRRDYMAIVDHEGLDPALLDANLQIHHAYALDGPELVGALDAEMRRGGFDLVVLDNYQSYSGATDLNDSAAWKSFISPLMRILKVYRAAMLLVDHTGKPQERKGWGKNDSVYIAAGTSRKANGARCSAELYSPVAGDERYRLHFGKNWERTGRGSRDLYLDRSLDHNAPYWATSEDQGERKPMVEGEAEVVAFATANPMASIREITKGTFIPKSTVQRILAKYPKLSQHRFEET